jgi:hypothetical protein
VFLETWTEPEVGEAAGGDRLLRLMPEPSSGWMAAARPCAASIATWSDFLERLLAAAWPAQAVRADLQEDLEARSSSTRISERVRDCR